MSKIFPSELEDSYEKIPNSKCTLEKNCSQIFVKGPAITKDLLEKMQKSDIGTKTTCVCGYEMQTRQFWVLAGLLVLFLLASTGVIIMWFTSIFDNAIFSNLAITQGSTAFEMWRKPSPKPLIKLHIFNYTNVEEFERGDDPKLKVKEVGPYVYEMSLERINIEFNKDIVSYQEERDYKFMPELSTGRKQNDRIVVPNIPLFSAASVNKHSSFLTRVGVSGLLNTLNAKPFLTMAAHKFITGYEDNLYSISKSVLKLQNQRPYDKFGILATNIGASEDVYSVNTGSKDINKIALINRFNSKKDLSYWSTDECNSLEEATDGSMYSPKTIRNKRPVQYFIKEMCRSLPLYFEKEVKILNGKIPAYRYSLPYSVFDAPEKIASNQCFCNLDSGECPPQGVFNATPCSLGAPAFISFPHFYNGDPSLRNGVIGLNPDPVNHKTYADVHPTLGFVMSGKTRMQLNVQVVKSFGISQVSKFENGLMLPVAWFELTLEDKMLPDDMVGLIFQTTFTLKSVELGLKYGCLLTVIVTLLCMLLVFRNRWQKRERTSSIRPLQRRENSV